MCLQEQIFLPRLHRVLCELRLDLGGVFLHFSIYFFREDFRAGNFRSMGGCFFFIGLFFYFFYFTKRNHKSHIVEKDVV